MRWNNTRTSTRLLDWRDAFVSGFYTPILVTHVLVAVLGLGSIASLVLVTSSARKQGRGPAEIWPLLDALLRYSVLSLAAMLLTGILLDVAARGAFHNLWWFRISALLLLLTGALHGQARRAVRGARDGQDGGDAILRKVERIACAMCALVAAITVLMEVKPFR